MEVVYYNVLANLYAQSAKGVPTVYLNEENVWLAAAFDPKNSLNQGGNPKPFYAPYDRTVTPPIKTRKGISNLAHQLEIMLKTHVRRKNRLDKTAIFETRIKILKVFERPYESLVFHQDFKLSICLFHQE